MDNDYYRNMKLNRLGQGASAMIYGTHGQKSNHYI